MFVSEAYRQASQGEWMRIAWDRRHFRRRILNCCAKRIEWCLHAVHRQKIKRVLFSKCITINYQKAIS